MKYAFSTGNQTILVSLGVIAMLIAVACAPAPVTQPTSAPKPAESAPTAAPKPAPTSPSKPEATSAPQSIATTPAKPAEQIPLRVGTGVDTSYLPFYVADKKGIFAQNGLSHTLSTFATGNLSCDAVAAGQFDICQMGDLSFVTPWSRGAALKVLANTARGPNIIKIVAKSAIMKPADLKGKKLGVLGGSSSDLAWILYLKHHGINRDEVAWVNVQPPEAPALLDKGDIDAFLFWEPWPLRSLQASGNKVHVLATAGDDNVYLNPLYVGVGDRYLQSQPEGVRRALKSLIDAVKYIQANTDESYKIGADVLKLKPEEFKDIVTAGNMKYDIVLDQASIDWLKQAANFMVDTKRIDKPLNLEQFIAPDSLKSVAPNAVTYTSLR